MKRSFKSKQTFVSGVVKKGLPFNKDICRSNCRHMSTSLGSIYTKKVKKGKIN